MRTESASGSGFFQVVSAVRGAKLFERARSAEKTDMGSGPGKLKDKHVKEYAKDTHCALLLLAHGEPVPLLPTKDRVRASSG